jgi:DNA-binding GntR family transcriptional regulator
MTKLEAIKQPLPLAKMAYKALRDSILTRELIPGEIYKEKALAMALGISRTPVREALLELSTQGLVTFLPRKGVMVYRYTRKDVEEIFEVRKIIESASVEKVAKASPPLDLSRVEKAFHKMQSSNKKRDALAFLDADRAFHIKLSGLIKNQRLLGILENSRDMTHLMGIKALDIENRYEEVIQEHWKVLDAVKNGKAAQAGIAMAYHLDRSREAVLKQHDYMES